MKINDSLKLSPNQKCIKIGVFIGKMIVIEVITVCIAKQLFATVDYNYNVTRDNVQGFPRTKNTTYLYKNNNDIVFSNLCR